jgi:hypothetical protein
MSADFVRAEPLATQTGPAPAKTQTPTVTPSPTLDAQATILALRATTAANEAAAAQAMLDAERIRATESAGKIQATQNAVYWQATATVAAEATEHEQSLAVIREQAYILATLNEAERLRQTDADRFQRTAGTVAGLVLAVGLVIAVVWVFVSSMREKRATSPLEGVQDEAEEQTEPLADDWDAVPFRIAHLTRARMAEIFPTPAQMVAFAVGIGLGHQPSHNVWVRENGLFSEQEFTRLQDALVRFGLAGWRVENEHRAGIKFTDAGSAFLGAVAGLAATPLPHSDAPNAAILAGKRQTDTPDGFEPMGRK